MIVKIVTRKPGQIDLVFIYLASLRGSTYSCFVFFGPPCVHVFCTGHGHSSIACCVTALRRYPGYCLHGFLRLAVYVATTIRRALI